MINALRWSLSEPSGRFLLYGAVLLIAAAGGMARLLPGQAPESPEGTALYRGASDGPAAAARLGDAAGALGRDQAQTQRLSPDVGVQASPDAVAVHVWDGGVAEWGATGTPLRNLLDAWRRAGRITSDRVTAALETIQGEIVRAEGRPTREDLKALAELSRLLAAQGADGVAGIRDFLRSGRDADFVQESGFPASLRLFALDALGRIDSLDALNVELSMVEQSRSPLELAALAERIDDRATGQYRPMLVKAARRLLSSAADAPGETLGPIYQRLAEWGEVKAPDLESLPAHQRQYGLVSLALLPGGEGLPALLDAVSGADAGIGNQEGRLALQLLAQVSAGQSLAGQELTAIAQEGLIPDSMWPEIAALVGGTTRIQLNVPGSGRADRSYIFRPEGNQLFYRVRDQGAAADSDAYGRIEAIDRLLEVAPGEAARGALEAVRARLEVQAAASLR